MKLNATFAFFLLFFVATTITEIFSDKLSKLLENANTIGITSERLSDTKSRVCINNQVYEIYVYDPTAIEGKQNPVVTYKDGIPYYNNLINKLHTCINCVFAKWLSEALFTIIEPLPILYHAEFINLHVNIFIKHIKESENKINYIIHKTRNLIDTLLNFQNIYLDVNDTFNNTDILKILLSLSFKVNYILYGDLSEAEISDVSIIRLILGEINDMQQFIYLNCELSSVKDYLNFYGMSIENESLEKKYIDSFLGDIYLLGLDSNVYCSINEILLFDISLILGETRWLTENGEIYVEDAIRTIIYTYDLLKIYWFQKHIFNTIMKQLFTLTVKHFWTNNTLSEKILKKIETIISSLFSDITNLPYNLVEYLSLMKSKEMDTWLEQKKFVNVIVDYLDSLSYIILKADSNLSINKSKGVNNIKLHKNNISISTLEEFMDYLNLYIEEFKCFLRLYEFLHYQYNDTYYRPFVNYSDNLRIFEQKLSEKCLKSKKKTNYTLALNEQKKQDKIINAAIKEEQIKIDLFKKLGCKFFKYLYQFFFVTALDFNNAVSEKYEPNVSERINYFPRIRFNLLKIKEVLTQLVTNYPHRSHLEIIFNVLPQIELKMENFFLDKNFEDLKRLLHVIMTELNKYGVEYCNPPEYNFMLFNNINFNISGQTSVIYHEITTSMRLMIDDSAVCNHKYSKIIDIFEMLSNSAEFKTYDAIIRLNWKGEKKKVSYIIKNFIVLILSSSDVFAFYDISFKFIFATIYCDVFQVKGKTIKQDEGYKNNLRIVSEEDENKFPKKFTHLVKLIKRYASPMVRNDCEGLKNHINNEFIKLGLYIDVEMLKSLIYQNDTKWKTHQYEFNFQTKIENLIILANNINK